MQDVQPLNGGRMLLRKLNHHHHHHHPHPQQHQFQGNFSSHQHVQQEQALKCPRCDSLNTKFCYYNNYNLSQPRHFCKNCRRYWTKGGVLRNVPIGGGCRKSKRSSSSSSSTSSKSKSSTTNSSSSIISKKNTQSSRSSSESSAVVGGGLFQIPEVENFGVSSSDFEPLVDSGEITGFINLLNNTNTNNDNTTSGGFENVSSAAAAATTSFSEYLQNQGVVQEEEWDMGKNFCGVHNEEDEKMDDLMSDPTVRIEDLLQNRGSNVGITSLDWNLTAGNNHQNLYDIPDNSTTVDHHHNNHQDYWSHQQAISAVHHDHHHHQWSDSTTSHLPLFLP